MIHEKLSKLSRPQDKIFDIKCEKTAINQHSGIIELVWELVTSNMYNKFEQETWIIEKNIVPQINVDTNTDDPELQLQ